jgi:CRISPR-associated endonuclease/helicase Cas3
MLSKAKRGGAPAALLDAMLPADGPRGLTSEGLGFFIRMLFSALVDADFLDTEAYFDRQRGADRGGWPPLSALLPVLDAHLDAKTEAALRDYPGMVNETRRDVLAACRARAGHAPGLFTLTVPTGGGKTLASLAFALRHAQTHGLRRVIYAIPYTSIIEQTADVFRGVFSPLGEVVVEHHSSLPPARETNRTRLAADNWDAPLIVTTTVQLFESLFAARTSRCRKLHNTAKSVLILDEAQLLPVEFLRPILFALDELMARYGVSVVLSTATQPALMQREGFAGLRAKPCELAPEPEALRQRLKRTRIERLHDLRRRVEWPELAALLSAEKRVLCIVDRRDAARDLYRLLPPGAFHLSALMCPQHRSEVLAEITTRLADPAAEVRVIATQLVEAGVDLDFPVVFRAAAGLDSIAQAAGRCNREGLLTEGRVVVFRAPLDPPDGVLRVAARVALPMLERDDGDPLTHDAFERYFRGLYWTQGARLDSKRIVSGQASLLARRDLSYAFRAASEEFRIIPQEQVPVIVRWGDAPRLVDEIVRLGLSRERIRGIQRFTVGVYRGTLQRLGDAAAVREIEPRLAPGLFVLERKALYSDTIGLDDRGAGLFAPEELMV